MVQLARYALEAVVGEGRSYREVAAAHGVSKSRVAKMVARYREVGYEALAPRSKAPQHIPNRTLPEVADEIVRWRKTAHRPGVGCRSGHHPLPPEPVPKECAFGCDHLAGA